MRPKKKIEVTISYTNTAEKTDYEESFVVEEEGVDRAIFASARLFFELPNTSDVEVTDIKVTLPEDEKEDEDDEGTVVQAASSLPAPENEGDTPGDPPAA